ncbi:MAG: hypothetical protein WED00_17940 [Aquisalimonadaceae bacterium]
MPGQGKGSGYRRRGYDGAFQGVMAGGVVDERVRPEQWFGDFDVPVNTTLHWHVGPMVFWVHRGEMEWRLATEATADPYDTTVELVRREETQPAEVTDSRMQRFLMRTDSPCLNLGVLLPDRPIVSRPVSPVSIPAGESVCFYLSYPLWVSVAVGKPGRKLTEFASHRLSDTWFGPNTQEGVLCYAVRTRCRLRLSDHSNVPNRAVTPLFIRNQSRDPLRLEKLQLPVATLSLYRSEEGGLLWTQSVTLVREEDGDMAALRLGSGPPEEAGKAVLVAGPREAPQRNAVFRAFSALF